MKIIDNIQKNVLPPINTRALWIDEDNLLKIFNNGHWQGVGFTKEDETLLDKIDKEIGTINNDIDIIKSEIDIAGSPSKHIIPLLIGNDDETKASNLKKLQTLTDAADQTFFADINYGYGTASWLPTKGGTAFIITDDGNALTYTIGKDGSCVKDSNSDVDLRNPIDTNQFIKVLDDKNRHGYLYKSENNTIEIDYKYTRPIDPSSKSVGLFINDSSFCYRGITISINGTAKYTAMYWYDGVLLLNPQITNRRKNILNCDRDTLYVGDTDDNVAYTQVAPIANGKIPSRYIDTTNLVKLTDGKIDSNYLPASIVDSNKLNNTVQRLFINGGDGQYLRTESIADANKYYATDGSIQSITDKINDAITNKVDTTDGVAEDLTVISGLNIVDEIETQSEGGGATSGISITPYGISSEKSVENGVFMTDGTIVSLTDKIAEYIKANPVNASITAATPTAIGGVKQIAAPAALSASASNAEIIARVNSIITALTSCGVFKGA